MEISHSQLTLYEAERFHKEIMDAVSKKGNSSFSLDFKGVEKIDLSCIQILLALEKHCRNKNITLEIRGVHSPKLRQAFAMLNLHRLLGGTP